MDEELFNRLMHGLFEFSPIAICVSTTGPDASRYVRVNDAYLQLVGVTWQELSGQTMAGGGVVIVDERRQRRQHLLESVGHYSLEEVEIRHSDGSVLSTLISAQRYYTGGVAYDIEIIVDVTARKRAEQALWRAAHIDGLTGVCNRSHFIDQLDRKVALSHSSGTRLALAMIDVDLFKRVNDSFGHMAGDRMLTRVADEIMGVVGCSGIVGRLGGDEFAVLFTDASDQRTIFQRIKAIIAAVEAASPPIEGASPATVTIGYAFMPDDAETADDLMRAADVALYRGKRGGRAVAIPFQETGATG